jgi:hypothetical protein
MRRTLGPRVCVRTRSPGPPSVCPRLGEPGRTVLGYLDCVGGARRGAPGPPGANAPKPGLGRLPKKVIYGYQGVNRLSRLGFKGPWLLPGRMDRGLGPPRWGQRRHMGSVRKSLRAGPGTRTDEESLPELAAAGGAAWFPLSPAWSTGLGAREP